MVLKRFMHFSQNVGAFRNQSQHSRLSNQISTLTILRDRGARRKVGGLTIEKNFFILKIEKKDKIIVFDLFLLRDFAYFIQYLLLFIGRH